MPALDAATTRGLNTLLPLFFLSGCAALIYEVVWFQSLTLIVGSNSVSMAVVLATYMGGMGLGSLVFLRRRPVGKHPLRVYAVLELIIALSGLLVMFVLPWAGGLYTSIGGGGFSGVLLRGLFSAIFLLAPTMAMGATLPAAASWVRATPQGVSRIGFFYSTNIVGGVVGSLLAAFYLLRVHDTLFATCVAMSLNVLVALISWWVAKHAPHEPTANTVAAVAEPVPQQRTPNGVIYLVIGISGACALAAEVVWARNLSLMLGGTVYGFAMILGATLAGLGLGSSVGAGIARNTASPASRLALCQVLAALGMAWASWSITDQLPNWPINPTLAPSPWFGFQLDFVRALWVILPAAMCWGASFPLAVAAVARSDEDGSRASARVYAANTAGAITGALLASLLLIRWIGTQRTQQLLMLLALYGALSLIWSTRPANVGSNATPRAAVASVVAGVLVVLSLSLVHTVPGLLVGYGRWAVSWLKAHGEFIYVGEGLNSTMAVSRMSDGTLNYHNAGKVQASNAPQDMRLQRMLGHLTTLLARDPQNVLVIGCGAGVTAGAVSINPAVKRQTIAEIEPLVPRVVSKYFSRENHGVVDNPKVTVHADDARHFLLTTDQKFDAITTDPFDNWVKGAATLNTLEFYTEMRKHLNPGGVVTVWLPLYETDREAFKSELATFMQVFPYTAVFGNTSNGQGYDGVLIGSADPLKIDVTAMKVKLQQPEYAPVLASLNEVGYGSVSLLLGTFASYAPEMRGWLTDAQINRDRNLRLQYLAGMAVNSYQQDSLYRELLAHGGWNADLFTGDPADLEALRQSIATKAARY